MALANGHLVFVFGTLKEGFPNFSHNAGTRVPGVYATSPAFPFFLVGERFSPWMMDSPGLGHRVRGQLFEVDAAALQDMDRLERIGEPDGYVRRKVAIRREDDPAAPEIEAFVYLKPAPSLDAREIRLGPLEEYTADHAALYRSRAAARNG